MNFLSEIQSATTRRWQFSVVLSIIVWNADFSQKVEYPAIESPLEMMIPKI